MTDIVTTPPTKTAAYGKAWLLDHSEIYQRLIERGDFTAEQAARDSTVAQWLIAAPGAHPVWHSYMLLLMHLRPNGLETKFYLPNATHELWLYALDPEGDRQKLLEFGLGKHCRWLTPCNFAAQIIAANDAEAFGRIESAVDDIISGQLSPDTDFRYMWKERFGSNMVRNP